MEARPAAYREQGTLVSGYEEKGPYHCGDCVHRQGETDRCIHPAVVNDPELKGHKHGSDWVQIDLAKGCCTFVKVGEPTGNPVVKAAKSTS